MDRAKIREIMLANGFTIKEGQTDLKEYVYEAAEALLKAAQADAAPARQSVWWLNELHQYAYDGGQPTDDTKRACGIAYRMLSNSWGFVPSEQITQIWEQLGGTDGFYKTFGYQQFAEALEEAFIDTNRIRLTPMEFDDGHRGWYFDNGRVYIDVELSKDGEYSAFFRDRVPEKEAYVEQPSSAKGNHPDSLT